MEGVRQHIDAERNYALVGSESELLSEAAARADTEAELPARPLDDRYMGCYTGTLVLRESYFKRATYCV